MNENASILEHANHKIAVPVGPEAIMGSTRMKAGTAQKLILNMLTTGSMVKYGKVYSNLMIDVQATNEKLVTRSRRIVMLATGCSYDEADEKLKETGNDVKIAIMMLLTGLSKGEATEKLEEHNGYIAKAIL
jgi:N-acetylmuramic acid 6-phosphate etherase